MQAKELRQMMAALELQGWRVRKGSKHHVLYPPDRRQPAMAIPTSPSDWRWRQNFITEARARGADVSALKPLK